MTEVHTERASNWLFRKNLLRVHYHEQGTADILLTFDYQYS